jgi:hypothetical protein
MTDIVERHGSVLRRRSATRYTTAGLGLSRISDAGKFLLPGFECGIVDVAEQVLATPPADKEMTE